MSDEKSFQYVKRMLPLFRAVVKVCSTNRLFSRSAVASCESWVSAFCCLKQGIFLSNLQNAVEKKKDCPLFAAMSLPGHLLLWNPFVAY